MKNIKKAFSLMTVFMMVFCLNIFSTSVSASEYTITISKPASSNISIAGQTFNAYKVFSLSYSGDNYSYTADDTCLSTDYAEVASSVGATDVAGILSALSGADEDANARKFADAVYNAYIKEKSPTVAGTATVAAGADSATIYVGEAGYFLVFGTATNLNGETGKNTVTSLVMLDTTDTAAQITAKVDAPSITKQIKHNESDTWGNVGDNQIGDTVEYRFISDIPYNVANFTSYDYIIHDSMTDGLTFNDNVAVYKDENKTSQLADTYVTVTKTNDQNFTVKIDVLGAINAGDLQATDTLYTYYSATLNKSALVAGSATDSTNHNDNTVYLEYSNNPYDTTSTGQTTTSQVYDWTFTFTVNKVDSNSNPLANAVFNIKKDGINLKFSSTETNVYIVDASGTIEDITTDGTGKFVIKGLDDNTEYTLSEKTPPDGYNKAADTVFSIQSGYSAGGNELTSLSATVGGTADRPLSVDVINNSGSRLVGTGGIGTTIFYVSGGILMIVAVVLLITKKRMNK